MGLAAARLRQSILSRAFEGKLVPQDPNDESASVLLERIRAEKNSAPKTNTKQRLALRVARHTLRAAGWSGDLRMSRMRFTELA